MWLGLFRRCPPPTADVMNQSFCGRFPRAFVYPTRSLKRYHRTIVRPSEKMVDLVKMVWRSSRRPFLISSTSVVTSMSPKDATLDVLVILFSRVGGNHFAMTRKLVTCSGSGVKSQAETPHDQVSPSDSAILSRTTSRIRYTPRRRLRCHRYRRFVGWNQSPGCHSSCPDPRHPRHPPHPHHYYHPHRGY